MKLLLMADGYVGLEILKWLLKEYPNDLVLVVSSSENEISALVKKTEIPIVIYKSSDQLSMYLNHVSMDLDIGIMAWWPYIIKQPLIKSSKYGFINTHPSLLPYNRGKHYNFWALVEQVPFGATLHFVDKGIDSGDIISQMSIPYGWEDNGATLYKKAKSTMITLFKKTYPSIRNLNIPRTKQDLKDGSFHAASEIDSASYIDLGMQYRAKDLLNLLRARTFPSHQACWFRDGDEEYEIRVEIKKRKSTSEQI